MEVEGWLLLLSSVNGGIRGEFGIERVSVSEYSKYSRVNRLLRRWSKCLHLE